MRIAGLALAALLISGCDAGPCSLAENELRGSIGELYDLTTDAVRVRQVDPDTVAVEFKHGNEIHAKILAEVRSFAKGAAIPLTDGDVQRITSPATSYPSDIERGNITFETELSAGSEAAGCFNTLFNMPDGSQRTLEGGFRATFEDSTQ